MEQTLNNPESARRQLQIQKLLEAINNYSPSEDEILAMKNAKNQMIKNIQKKFAVSKVNLTYQFPFKASAQTHSDNQEIQDIPQICILRAQNIKAKQFSRSKQKNRRPLLEKSSNKSQANLHSLKKLNESSKQKAQNGSFLKNIETAFKSGLKCQTPKVIKKQIILTNKKQLSKENTKNQMNYCDQGQDSQSGPVNNIKAKLKIKQLNNCLNEAKKQIHLRTQNNINFKNYTEYSNSKSRFDNFNEDENSPELELFAQAKTQQKYIIYEEPSEQSMFFNSRNNQSIDQNTKFQYPKTLFNVSDLKQKLRQTSKSNKKQFIKRHKRTATEGCPEIKIKLFTNSFHKKSCEKSQAQKDITFSSSLFKKNDHTVSITNIMNRTVSSLSQHSLKKGIKLYGKTAQNGERSLSKGSIKYDQLSVKATKKYTISKLGKGGTQEMSMKKQKKNLTSTDQFLMKEDLRKGEQKTYKNVQNKQLKDEKQNIQVNRTSKINSIMTSLKQGYKVKNGNAKAQMGIKTTVCR